MLDDLGCWVMDIRRHPEKHGMGRAVFGIVLEALGTIALVAFLVALATE